MNAHRSPLDRSQIGEDFRVKITTQSYGVGNDIDGVRLIDLRLHSDEGGDFCELARFDITGMLSGLDCFRPAQMSYSLMLPGTVKAWHLHFAQEDLWFVPPSDRLLVGLLDVRAESTTYRHHMRFVMGAGRSRLLYIPRGVAHGLANLTERAGVVLYFVSQAFDANDPDEQRLPFDLLGGDFWKPRIE